MQRARIGLLERRGGQLGRDLSRLRAAHAVRDGEERRRHDVGVLVPAALLAGVARPRVVAGIEIVRLRRPLRGEGVDLCQVRGDA